VRAIVEEIEKKLRKAGARPARREGEITRQLAHGAQHR
jgi:hypothetical protein